MDFNHIDSQMNKTRLTRNVTGSYPIVMPITLTKKLSTYLKEATVD